MSESQVVVDASFLLKIFLPEEESDQVEGKWRSWIEDSVEIIAPTLFVFEVSSVIRNKVYRGILEEHDAKDIIDQMRDLDLALIYTEDLLDIAWEVGSALNTSTLYDCFYIALSTFLEIPLWTCDKKLFNAAKKKFPLINLL